MDALFTFRTPTNPDPPTTDNFATVRFDGIPGQAPDPGNQVQFTGLTSGPISANWKNTHGSNSITVRVLGTNDKDAADTDCDVVIVAQAIAAGAMLHFSINPAVYAYYRFQHKATGAGNQGASKITGAHHRV